VQGKSQVELNLTQVFAPHLLNVNLSRCPLMRTCAHPRALARTGAHWRAMSRDQGSHKPAN
jgi:hypothetical protein